MARKTASRDAGARAYRAAQRRESIARVRAFRRWSKSGCDRRYLPDKLPTAGDFAIAREAGVPR